MSCLLDTHALIWWWIDSPRLSVPARNAIIDSDDVFVSAASVWELATLTRVGRLNEIEDFVGGFGPLVERNRFLGLAINERHAMRAGLLPGRHRDPFDRMIAAQALIEGLTVITRDPALAAFGCAVVW